MSGPVIVSPDLLTNTPPPEPVTAESTYDLLAASPACTGVGKTGETANCLVPLMVSAPETCTTAESSALLASAASTYCFVTGGFAEPADPRIVRTAATVVGEVVGTDQNSVLTVRSSSWYTTVYTVFSTLKGGLNPADSVVILGAVTSSSFK